MADRAAELHGGWLWTRGGGASPRGETWRRRWFTLVKDQRRAVLEFRAAQTSPKPLARLALTPSSECIRLVGADARRAATGRNCPAGVVLRFSIGGVTRLARASESSPPRGATSTSTYISNIYMLGAMRYRAKELLTLKSTAW